MTAHPWRRITHADPAFSVEIPTDPQWVTEPDDPDAGSLASAPDSDHVYVVTWTRADDADHWLALQRAAITGGRTVLDDTRVSSAEVRIVAERELGYVQTTRVIVHGRVGYMVIATVRSRASVDAERFLRSFAVPHSR